MGKNKQPNVVSSKKPDFQKVKFKVGKKLPKNLNETRATFKAKTLIIKQQFQEKEGPVSHRNLTWKELLAHLGHLNQSVKLDALNSLREMIVQNEELIRLEFSTLLENVCPLFTDREYKVRENAINLFKTLILLPIFSKSQVLKPFYNLITVYLSCAMTHISDNIKYSSLKILDILCDHLPQLVKLNAYTIFDNFVEQISKASVKNDSKRVLKNDPLKFSSTQSWRFNVLTRLHKFLSIISKDYTNSNSEEENRVLQTNTWILNFDHFNTKPVCLSICKKITNKKNVMDLDEFYRHYLKIVAPLLIDCWIEARPDKNYIETNESLSIMFLVMSILNLMMDYLKLTVEHLAQFIRIPKSSSVIEYIEGLFLAEYPFILAENFELENDQNKKLSNDQISVKSLNLLISKFSSSSFLLISEEKCLEILSYCIKSMESTFSNKTNELQILIKICQKIFSNFQDSNILKPFLNCLLKMLDSDEKAWSNKYAVFEFLSQEFTHNQNICMLNNSYIVFFNQLLKFLLVNLKEKKYDHVEYLVDWTRNLLIKKLQCDTILKSLENEYINIVNLADFKNKDLDPNMHKKIIELVNWLPRINRYLFTKLAFLILSNSLTFFNTNQLLHILKNKMESESCDQNDYLMFLLHLFNGHSSFELIHETRSNVAGEFFIFQKEEKFKFHAELCQMKQSETTVVSPIVQFVQNSTQYNNIENKSQSICTDFADLHNSSVPILNKIEKGVFTTTLFGSLCLISQIDDISNLSQTYDNIITVWLGNSFYWIATKYFELRSNPGFGQESNLACVDKLFRKSVDVICKNDKIINDCIVQIANMLNLSNDLNNIKNVLLIINFFMKNYSTKLSPSIFLFENILNVFQKLNETDFIWWHEYTHLIKTLKKE